MARTFTATAGQRLTHAAAVVTAEPFSWACWFYPSDPGTGLQVLISIAAASNNDDFFLLFIENATGKLGNRKGFVSGSGNALTDVSVATNVWQHAVGTTSASNARTIRLNGGTEFTNSTSITFGTTPTRTGIGHNARLNQDNIFNGRIAHCAIWNVVLTAEEQISLSRGFSPLLIRPSALKMYVPVIGNASPEPDVRGSFNMTINGTLNQAADEFRFFRPGRGV